MTLEEFREEVKRTMPDLGSELLNRIHMSMGMASEISELLDAIDTNDQVNISEELSDVLWYACNDLTIHNFKTPELQSLLDITNTHETNLFRINTLVKCISALVDLDKKELAYNKSQDTEHRNNLLDNIIMSVEFIAKIFNINMNESRDKVIRKLRKRYPEKFDETLAKERNLEAERKELEN